MGLLPDSNAVDLTPPDAPETQLIVTPEQFGGVWANYAEISRTPHEVTLDFYRVGPGGKQGMCQARVNCSPLMLEQLGEQLDEHRAAIATES